MPAPLWDRLRAAARTRVRPTPPTPQPPQPPQPTANAVEQVERLLRAGTPESVDEAVAIGRATGNLTTDQLGPLAARFVVIGRRDLARDLVEEADRRGPDALDRRQRGWLQHVRTWTHPAEPPAPPPDAVRLGIFHYRQPDRGRSSKNIGDYVQTLAMLGNLVRFTDVEFSGADGLGQLATELQTRVRPELRLAAGGGRAHLVPVSRDFSEGDQIADGTWLLAFGWHLHGSFGLGFGMPYHPGLRPLFVSFHLNNLAALDEPTVAYLRAYGPIGCRDWTTVDLLLSADVDAFFTGCVTSTVDAVFPRLSDLDRSEARTIGVIDTAVPGDLPPGQPVEVIQNADPRYRRHGLVSGTRAASATLEDYRQRFDRIVTSRLHAYLPATSLGIEVDFRPKNPGDVRFPGLGGLQPDSAELDRMRDGIRDLVADAVGRILAGASSDDVYAAWRSSTEVRVEQARARLRAPGQAYPPVSGDAVTRRDRSATNAGPATDVAVLTEGQPVARVVEAVRALTAASSGALRVWTVSRGVGGESLPLPGGHLDLTGLPAAADLLLLPRLVPEASRMVVLGCDDGPVDVTALAGTDLHGRGVGAYRSEETAAEVWRHVAHRLRPEPAAELRRAMSRRHPFSARAFADGPLVMDLDRLRADPEVEDSLALAAHVGLDGRQALLAHAASDVTPLDRTG